MAQSCFIVIKLNSKDRKSRYKIPSGLRPSVLPASGQNFDCTPLRSVAQVPAGDLDNLLASLLSDDTIVALYSTNKVDFY